VLGPLVLVWSIRWVTDSGRIAAAPIGVDAAIVEGDALDR
jgi:hypothetical protein